MNYVNHESIQAAVTKWFLNFCWEEGGRAHICSPLAIRIMASVKSEEVSMLYLYAEGNVMTQNEVRFRELGKVYMHQLFDTSVEAISFRKQKSKPSSTIFFDPIALDLCVS